MKTFERRLSKLENRLGVSDNIRLLVIVDDAGRRRGLDDKTCIQILDESGFLRTSGIVLVDLHDVPSGLSAEETKRFLRENGARICGPRGADRQGTEERN